MARALTLLPHPDSPTSARNSPSPRVRSSPLTAWTDPKETWRSWISSKGFTYTSSASGSCRDRILKAAAFWLSAACAQAGAGMVPSEARRATGRAPSDASHAGAGESGAAKDKRLRLFSYYSSWRIKWRVPLKPCIPSGEFIPLELRSDKNLDLAEVPD